MMDALEIIYRYGWSIFIVCVPMLVLIVGAAISNRQHFTEL